jgi:hypothetical protein
MVIRSVKSILAASGLVFLLTGCQLGPDQCTGGSCLTSQDENLQINPAAVMAEQDPNFSSVQVFDDRLVFTGKGPASEFGYQVDDILVSSNAVPGFIRYVTSLEERGGKLVVYTVDAAPTELFRGRLQRHIDLSQGLDRPIIRDGKGNILLKPYEKYPHQRLPIRFNVSAAGVDIEGDISFDTASKSLVFNGVKVSKTISGSLSQLEGGSCNDSSQCLSGFSCQGDANQADGKIEGECTAPFNAGVKNTIALSLDGQVKPIVDADLDLDVGWSWLMPTVDRFLISFTGGMDINFSKVGLSSTTKATLDKEIEIGSVRINTPIPIGPIVIPAALKFSFFMGTENEFLLVGESWTNLALNSSFTLGAEYLNEGGWHGIKTGNFDASSGKLEGRLNGHVKLSVYVKPEILFEFVRNTDVGPAVYLKPALNLLWQFLPERCLEIFFNLTAGFELKADSLSKLCDAEGSSWLVKRLCKAMSSVLEAFSVDWELYKKILYTSCKQKVCKKDKVGGDSSEDLYWWDKEKNQLVPDDEFGLFSHCDKEDPVAVCCGGECVELCGKGNLEGLVVDKADETKKIQGAHVVLKDSDGNVKYDGVTGADGVYRVNDLDAGYYTLEITANGYYPYSADIQIRSNETKYVAKLEAIPSTCDMDGTISGTVTDATTNNPIDGAELQFRKMSDDSLVDTAKTDQNGNYKSKPLPIDYYKIVVTAAGYGQTEVENVSVCGYDDNNPDNDDTVQNITIAPAEGFYHVVLMWGSSPKDLDLHVKLPSGDQLFYRSGCRGDRDNPPYTELDVDVRGGYGPETVTITQPQQGSYQFFVHNYGDQNDPDDSGSLKSSSARLVVSDPAGNTLRTFDVPASCGSYFWNAFNLKFDANGKATVEATNTCGGGSNPADYEDPPICNLP